MAPVKGAAAFGAAASRSISASTRPGSHWNWILRDRIGHVNVFLLAQPVPCFWTVFPLGTSYSCESLSFNPLTLDNSPVMCNSLPSNVHVHATFLFPNRCYWIHYHAHMLL